ncbi:MAG: hypothetical protein AB7G11_03405 [Phycisphaerales bacterium]
MQPIPRDPGTREPIAPAALVLHDPVPPTPWWESPWFVPACVGAALAFVLIVLHVARRLRRRSLDARERSFILLSRRLRLTARERAIVRALAQHVAPAADSTQPAPSRAESHPASIGTGPVSATARQPAGVKDLLELRSLVRRSSAEAVDMVRAISCGNTPPPTGEPLASVKASASPHPPDDPVGDDEPIVPVAPVVVLLSEPAFVSGANRWLQTPGRRDAEIDHVSRLQQKIYARARG